MMKSPSPYSSTNPAISKLTLKNSLPDKIVNLEQQVNKLKKESATLQEALARVEKERDQLAEKAESNVLVSSGVMSENKLAQENKELKNMLTQLLAEKAKLEQERPISTMDTNKNEAILLVDTNINQTNQNNQVDRNRKPRVLPIFESHLGETERPTRDNVHKHFMISDWSNNSMNQSVYFEE